MTKIEVIGICSNGTAVVSTTGRYRVVLQPENEVAAELLTAKQAHKYVKGFNEALDDDKHWAESIGYEEVLNGKGGAV